MSRTFRRAARKWDDEPQKNDRKRDGGWNGRFSREMEEREIRSQKHQKKVDRRQIMLASLEE